MDKSESQMMQSVSLLRNIRDVMAGVDSGEKKLSQIVELISSKLKTDVCSIYILRAGDVLELFANIGLNPSSIHAARLSLGEGLVGYIAAQAVPLNLSDAKNHPNFVYLPITGEETFNSFLGVPLIRGGRVLGVLVIQNREQRVYNDDIVDTLQTIAMVVSEVVASGDLINKAELDKGSGERLFPRHYKGVKLSSGMAIGNAYIHHANIEVTKFVADDSEYEQKRFIDALNETRRSIDEIIETSDKYGNEELSSVMEAYRLFAYDQGWAEKISDAIEGGLTAEAAVQKVQEQIRVKMEKSNNSYLIERMYDIETLGNRVMLCLTGDKDREKEKKPDSEFILVARQIGPAELLEYDRKKIKAIIMEDSSTTSHVVIIAKALDIPTVGGVRGITSHVKNGESLVVNGNSGEIYLSPTEEIERSVANFIKLQNERKLYFASHRNEPAITVDGKRVMVNMNAGLFIDTSALHESGADGIGLYRTELPYMMAKSFPTIASQADIYSQVLKNSDGKRVIFRTFDIGGDKHVSYIKAPMEENPAMGWRATRIALDHPSILKRQIRALIKAAEGFDLYIMFPFISEVSEFLYSKQLMLRELEDLKKQNAIMPSSIKYGVMIEVPAIIWQLDNLFQHIDFASIGSNDLMQFTFACDRNSREVSGRYDNISHGVFNMLEYIINKAKKNNVEIGFCGEMASKPIEAMCLIALGYESLSMPAASVGSIKQAIRNLNLAKFKDLLDSLRAKNISNLRGIITDYAKDNGIPV